MLKRMRGRLVLSLCIGTTVICGCQAYRVAGRCRQQAVAANAEEAGRARVSGRAATGHWLTAPLPTALPLVGDDGTDGNGYPRRWVDRAALRSLLGAQRFSDLTRYFEELQSAFEKDPRKEYWIADAAAAFDGGEADCCRP